jgi:hypothetical protein
MIPAICGLTALSLATAACGAGAIASADARHGAPRSAATARPAHPATAAPATAAPATTTSPAATAPPPANAPPPASAPPASPPVAGVIADCTSAPPHRLSVRPAAITIACADDGLGVQDMAWTSWTASAATGQGTLWEKLCQPNCAEGKIGHYPVTVTISAVRTSKQGPWFSTLTISWDGTRPPNSTPDSFQLAAPGS